MCCWLFFIHTPSICFLGFLTSFLLTYLSVCHILLISSYIFFAFQHLYIWNERVWVFFYQSLGGTVSLSLKKLTSLLEIFLACADSVHSGHKICRLVGVEAPGQYQGISPPSCCQRSGLQRLCFLSGGSIIIFIIIFLPLIEAVGDLISPLFVRGSVPFRLPTPGIFSLHDA